MSRRYSIAEARSRLPTIVDQVESGREIELTRRGQPVAVVVSSREFARLRGRQATFRDAYRRFVDTYALDAVGLERNFAASTRDRTSGRRVVL